MHRIASWTRTECLQLIHERYIAVNGGKQWGSEGLKHAEKRRSISAGSSGAGEMREIAGGTGIVGKKLRNRAIKRGEPGCLATVVVAARVPLAEPVCIFDGKQRKGGTGYSLGYPPLDRVISFKYISIIVPRNTAIIIKTTINHSLSQCSTCIDII